VLTVTTSNIIKNRGAKNPNRQKSGFIQASPLPNEEIRRASEQTSPQVAFISNTILGVGEDQGTVVLSFTGEHTQKVDSKGRMSIPADFRRVLEAGDPAWNPGQSPRMYLLSKTVSSISPVLVITLRSGRRRPSPKRLPMICMIGWPSRTTITIL